MQSRGARRRSVAVLRTSRRPRPLSTAGDLAPQHLKPKDTSTGLQLAGAPLREPPRCWGLGVGHCRVVVFLSGVWEPPED